MWQITTLQIIDRSRSQSDHGVGCDRLLPFKSLTEVDHNLTMVWDVTDYYLSNHWQRYITIWRCCELWQITTLQIIDRGRSVTIWPWCEMWQITTLQITDRSRSQSDHGVRCDRLLPFKSLTEVDQWNKKQTQGSCV